MTAAAKGDSNKGDGGGHHDKRKKSGLSYDGHTSELKGYLITHDGNKPTQFRDLLERLSTYGAKEYSAEVGTALETLEPFSMKHFMPKPLNESEYTSPKVGQDGAYVRNNDGAVVFEIDTKTKATLEKMQEKLVEKCSNKFSEYESGIKAMFRIILGQVDDNVKTRLEATRDWAIVKGTLDTIRMLQMLRDICYQDTNSTVHPLTNLLRTWRKLCTSKQRNEDPSTYVRETMERFKVFKALGGNVLMPGVVKASLSHEDINFEQYCNLPRNEQAPYNARAEAYCIATLLIEGCDQDTSILRRTLQQQYALGQRNTYPRDPTKALEMIQEFSGTRDKPTQPAKRKPQKDKSDKTEQKDSQGHHKRNGSTKTGSTMVTDGATASTDAKSGKRDIKGAKFSMFDYLEEIILNLPEEFKGECNTPASNHLFTINEDAEKLPTDKADTFHHYVAKLLFMAKRTRPDIGTAIAFLCTRVREPDVDDWKKLSRVLKYLQGTAFLSLNLGWDGSGDVNWYVDASFAVHKDMRSHTGGMMTLGQGAVISTSTKQKINTKSSTEAELVGVDDIMNIQVWTRYFIDAQFAHSGEDLLCKKDRLHQDNMSSIKLEKNGKASSTKRTRHIDIRYFFITDRVKKGKIEIEYCPTEEMIADFFTKPLQGKQFRVLRNNVLGIDDKEFLACKDAYYEAKRAAARQSVAFVSDNDTSAANSEE